jgi:hypothetical protein
MRVAEGDGLGSLGGRTGDPISVGSSQTNHPLIPLDTKGSVDDRFCQRDGVQNLLVGDSRGLSDQIRGPTVAVMANALLLGSWISKQSKFLGSGNGT